MRNNLVSLIASLFPIVSLCWLLSWVISGVNWSFRALRGWEGEREEQIEGGGKTERRAETKTRQKSDGLVWVDSRFCQVSPTGIQTRGATEGGPPAFHQTKSTSQRRNFWKGAPSLSSM